jgi:hypothetical protein
MWHLKPADNGSSPIARRSAAVARRTTKAASVVLAIHAIGLADCQADNAIKQANDGVSPQSVGCAHSRTVAGTTAVPKATGHGPSAASPDGTAEADIPVWRTITLGAPNNVHALRAALKKGCRIGRLADRILDRTTLTASKSRAQVDLIILSAADLGFTGETTSRAAIYRRATALDLELCPAEVGPQLRLQYPNQKPGELLHIAMQPIATRRQEHVAFVVGNGGDKLLLVGSATRPEHRVYSDLRFVFCSF